MRSLRSSLLSALAAVSFAGAASAQQQDLGLRIGIQPWTPVTDDDRVFFPVDSPTRLSDGLAEAWSANKQDLHAMLTSVLQAPDLIYKGVTMYRVDLAIAQPEISFEKFAGSGITTDPWKITMGVFLKVRLTASFTTPEADLPVLGKVGLGRWADLRCTGEVGVYLRAPLLASNVKGAAVRLDTAGPAPLVDIRHADFSGGNAGCSALVGAAELVGLKDGILDKLKRMGNAKANTLAKTYGAQAAEFISAQIAPYEKPEYDLGRLAFFSESTAHGRTLMFALSPRVLPDPAPGSGFLRGTLRVAGAEKVVCSQMRVTAFRKTGPRPITSAKGHLGDEPLEQLSASVSCPINTLLPGQNGEYTVRGLSATFPNKIVWSPPHGNCSTQNSTGKMTSLTLTYEGPRSSGVSDNLLPQDQARPHSLVAEWTSILCPFKVTPNLPGTVGDYRDRSQPDPNDRIRPDDAVAKAIQTAPTATVSPSAPASTPIRPDVRVVPQTPVAPVAPSSPSIRSRSVAQTPGK